MSEHFKCTTTCYWLIENHIWLLIIRLNWVKASTLHSYKHTHTHKKIPYAGLLETDFEWLTNLFTLHALHNGFPFIFLFVLCTPQLKRRASSHGCHPATIHPTTSLRIFYLTQSDTVTHYLCLEPEASVPCQGRERLLQQATADWSHAVTLVSAR